VASVVTVPPPLACWELRVTVRQAATTRREFMLGAIAAALLMAPKQDADSLPMPYDPSA
jgi:hypothetical protein